MSRRRVVPESGNATKGHQGCVTQVARTHDALGRPRAATGLPEFLLCPTAGISGGSDVPGGQNLMHHVAQVGFSKGHDAPPQKNSPPAPQITPVPNVIDVEKDWQNTTPPGPPLPRTSPKAGVISKEAAAEDEKNAAEMAAEKAAAEEAARKAAEAATEAAGAATEAAQKDDKQGEPKPVPKPKPSTKFSKEQVVQPSPGYSF